MADRPEAEAARDIAKRFIADLQDGLAPDKEAENILTEAILSAFPQIAPTEDVMEGARNLVGNWCRSGLTGSANFARIAGDQIAAALTAHAAREREAIEQIIERRMKDMDESMAHYGKPGGSYEMVERADHAKHAYADILTAIRARKP